MALFGPPNVENLKAKGDVKGLIKALGYEKDANVREDAVKALGQIGAPAVKPLIAALKSGIPLVRAGAAETLGVIGEQLEDTALRAEMVKMLITAVAQGRGGAPREAFVALRKIGKDDQALEQLIATLKGTNKLSKINAAWALGIIGSQLEDTPLTATAVETLIATLAGEGDHVPQAAGQALAKMGDLAVKPVIALLENEEQSICEVAARILGEMGEPAIEALIATLKHPSASVRQYAVEALGHIGNARAVDPLVSAHADEEWRVRLAATESLGRVKDARAVEPLTAALKHPSASVRAAAAKALTAMRVGADVRQAASSAVDAETAAIIGTRERGLQFFNRKASAGPTQAQNISTVSIHVSGYQGTITSISISGEQEAERFRSITLQYLEHKAYVEAIAALGMVSSICTQIAPPGWDRVLERSTPDDHPLKQAALTTHKIFSNLDFKSEMKAVLEYITRRGTSSLLDILMAGQQEGTDATASLIRMIESSRPLVRDDIFVGACIDYLGERTGDMLGGLEAIETLALIPDTRTIPHLLKAFDQFPFYPDGIDAIMRMGEAAHPHLLEALGADGSVSPHLHFNLSLALGTMEVEAARPIFEGALAASTNPIERIGSAYGLVCLGESKWLGEILAALDHASDDVRHAAAVGLEHLPQPLEDAVYARHLSDMNMLVRLRLTRKLGSQGTDNPALVDALIARLEDNEEAIRSAAIDAVAALGAEGIYDRMVMLAQSENPTLRACAYRVLGKRSDPRAIPLLIQVIQEDSTPGARKAAISALGDLGAVTAVEEIGAYLDDEELSDAAFWALLSIGMKDSETVKEVLNRRPYQKKRPFLQKLLDSDKAKQKRLSLLALLGDGMAKMQIQGMLSPHRDTGSLLSIIDYVRIVADPDFEDPLRKLLDYKDPQHFPGDRYISYMAFKILVRTLLAKG